MGESLFSTYDGARWSFDLFVNNEFTIYQKMEAFEYGNYQKSLLIALSISFGNYKKSYSK